MSADDPRTVFDIVSPITIPREVTRYTPPEVQYLPVRDYPKHPITPQFVSEGSRSLGHAVFWACVALLCIVVTWKLVGWVIAL